MCANIIANPVRFDIGSEGIYIGLESGGENIAAGCGKGTRIVADNLLVNGILIDNYGKWRLFDFVCPYPIRTHLRELLLLLRSKPCDTLR